MSDLPKEPPLLPLRHLDTLWVQVTGTLCNLACLHCFISCGPKNDRHKFMSVAEVRGAVDQGAELGVKEIYFTGGEPFLHPDIKEMILYALEVAPVTILTNGILIDEGLAQWIGHTFENSVTSLDIRVSLDGLTAEQNDPIRGRGSFCKIIAGIQQLAKYNVNPVITVTECHEATCSPTAHEDFKELLAEVGVSKPRLKFLAPFKLGRESRRDRQYHADERLYEDEVNREAVELLQCSSCRMITSEGVYPCPILINEPLSRMGDDLADGLHSIRLDHPACHTCYWEGVSCRT